jgi:sugar (pentulose or hexulose) kinase
VAVSASGDMLAGASRPLTSHRDGPRHEQDPGEWWDALATACREKLAGLPRRPIGGLALCGTSLGQCRARGVG